MKNCGFNRIRHPNRTKKMQPRGRGFWCSACDHDIVRAGGKCDNCGKIAHSKRAKKLLPEIIEL